MNHQVDLLSLITITNNNGMCSINLLYISLFLGQSIEKNNPERCSLTGQILILLSEGHQFEFHKS